MIRIACLLLAAAVASTAHLPLQETPSEPLSLELEEQWRGVVPEDEMRSVAPTLPFVAAHESWRELWRAWRPEEPLPEVDFESEVVLVRLVDGPNRIKLSATLDEDGAVQVRARNTRIAGPGFGYALARISRQGVKSIDGEPLPSRPECGG